MYMNKNKQKKSTLFEKQKIIKNKNRIEEDIVCNNLYIVGGIILVIQ
jgi:hypothetical protein